MKNQNENQEVDGKTSLPISITDLTKTYGKVFALNSVSIEVEAGEFLTLLGPSGSGKTTLLMAIAGFNRPDSGSIVFGKKEMISYKFHKYPYNFILFNCTIKSYIIISFSMSSNQFIGGICCYILGCFLASAGGIGGTGTIKAIPKLINIKRSNIQLFVLYLNLYKKLINL